MFGRAAVALPLVLFLLIALVLGIGLHLRPQEIPSALIHRPAPQFSLPPVMGRSLGLSTADLRGSVSVVNVFASWCVPCRQEHPVFLRAQKEGAVAIHGLNYKDAPANAAAWLDQLGDPYVRTGADLDGRVGIDWGVYGVPETFVIAKDGTIAYKHIGPISETDWDNVILPLVRLLSAR